MNCRLVIVSVSFNIPGIQFQWLSLKCPCERFDNRQLIIDSKLTLESSYIYFTNILYLIIQISRGYSRNYKNNISTK